MVSAQTRWMMFLLFQSSPSGTGTSKAVWGWATEGEGRIGTYESWRGGAFLTTRKVRVEIEMVQLGKTGWCQKWRNWVDQTLEQMDGQETVYFCSESCEGWTSQNCWRRAAIPVGGLDVSYHEMVCLCVVPHSSVLFQYLISMIYDVLIQSIR